MPDNEVKAVSFLDQIRQAMGDPDFDFVFGEFKPCATYYPAMDFLLYLEKDTSYTSQYIPGTNIELLWDNHPDYNGKLVGVKINAFSHVVSPEIIASYMETHSISGSPKGKKSDG